MAIQFLHSTQLLLTTTQGQAGDPLADAPLYVAPDAQIVGEDFFSVLNRHAPLAEVSLQPTGSESVKEKSLAFTGAVSHHTFNPSSIRVSAEAGIIVYHDSNLPCVETDISYLASCFDSLMRFFELFVDTRKARQLMEWLKKSFEPGINPENLDDEPDAARFDLAEGQFVSFRLSSNNNLSVEWSGLLPDNKKWELHYRCDGRLQFIKGNNTYISPLIFAAACKPQLLSVQSALDDADDESCSPWPVQVLSDLSGWIPDLAQALETQGQPHHHVGSILWPAGILPGLEGHDLAQWPRTPVDLGEMALPNSLNNQSLKLMQQLSQFQQQLSSGDTTVALDYLHVIRRLQGLPMTGGQLQALLPNGSRVTAFNIPQRLEIRTSAGKTLRPSTLYETLIAINLQMETRQICYSLKYVPSGFVMQIFVFNQAMDEWQYFTRLDFDTLGMRPTHVREDEAGKELMNDKQDFHVDSGTLDDAWEFGRPQINAEDEIGATDEDILRRAHLVAPTPIDDDRALQDDYANTVSEFLALVMNDVEEFFPDLSAAEVFSGEFDPHLQFVSFTYSNEIHSLIRRYNQLRLGTQETKPLLAEERMILAERFRFASTHPEHSVLAHAFADPHIQDWIDAIDRDVIYGRVKILHDSLKGHAGLFTVVLDLRASAARATGGMPSNGSRKKKRSTQGTLKESSLWLLPELVGNEADQLTGAGQPEG